jgi:hypothetical protein
MTMAEDGNEVYCNRMTHPQNGLYLHAWSPDRFRDKDRCDCGRYTLEEWTRILWWQDWRRLLLFWCRLTRQFPYAPD